MKNKTKIQVQQQMFWRKKIGEAEFPLNAFYERPKSNAESDEMRKYFTQLRHEVGSRLVEKVTINHLLMSKKLVRFVADNTNFSVNKTY